MKQGKNRSPVFVFLTTLCLSLLTFSLLAQTPAKRPLTAEDVYRTRHVGDPQVSPDGKWIAYTVTSMDREADKLRSVVWLVNWEGTQCFQVTFGPESDTSPRWSPDGKFLAFLSTRPAEGKAQVWLLDRRGGEARPLTEVKGQIEGYEWSPDAKHLVLVMQEAADDAGHAPVVFDDVT